MSIALLDVNVLIAIFDTGHVHNGLANAWLSENRKTGWATCPLTLNGCVRILSNPAYPLAQQSTADMIHDLKSFCAAPDHHFWPDSVSLLDETLFRPALIGGHKKITDVYLLGLAVPNHGRLATFDRSIPLEAVNGARRSNLAIIR